MPFRAHATFASTLLAELAHPAHFRRARLPASNSSRIRKNLEKDHEIVG